MICLPELFRYPYFCQREDATWFDLAEPVPGPTTDIVGSVAEVAYSVAPGVVDQVLHVAYRVFPDSAAARGDDDGEGEGPTRAAEALTRLLPGVHW